MRIQFLKAFHGDSILISFNDSQGNTRNILIDGGPSNTYQYEDKRTRHKLPGDLKLALDNIFKLGQKIDLLILTHIDDDHINGLKKWFEDKNCSKDLVGKVWFNSGNLIAQYFKTSENNQNEILLNLKKSHDTSVTQAISFERYLIDRDILWESNLIKAKEILTEFGIEFKILSPNLDKLSLLLKKYKKEKINYLTSKKDNDYKYSISELIKKDQKEKFLEDNSETNGSSIAFILTYNSENFLFLADAHPSMIIESLNHFGYTEINPLKAKLVKVSHHGSKYNTNNELLKLINSENFIILTNGDIHNLPDKQCLARIITLNSDVNLLFNYPERAEIIFLDEDKKNFKFLVDNVSNKFL